jgi:Ca-activated chloride channel family protein
MRIRFLPAVVALASLAFAVPAAHAGSPIRVKAELAQSVLPEGEGGHVYLRVGLEGIAPEDESHRAPANVVIVIDQSGSMRGDRIAQAREAALMAVDRLDRGDVLGVIAYATEAYVLSPAAPLRDTGSVRARISHLQAEGNTALYAGVRNAIGELRPYRDPYKINRVILLSDGMANVGPSSPAELEALGREAAREGISITTIGLGLGYNEDLMTRLALASDGSHAFVEEPGDLMRVFDAEFGDVLSAVGGDVDVIIECPEGFSPMRALGREARIEGRRVHLKLNQIYGKQEKYVVVELDVDKAHAKGSADAAKVEVKYTDMVSKQRQTLDSKAAVRFSASKAEVEGSINSKVKAAVATQVATERNERAVSLRDAGKVEEARKLLKENAIYLNKQAEQAPAAAAQSLRALSQKNVQDAESLTGRDWERQRKLMRAQQYKDKTQQKY